MLKLLLQQSRAKDAFNVQIKGLENAKTDLEGRDNTIKGLLEKERKNLANWGTQKRIADDLKIQVDEAISPSAPLQNKLSEARAKSNIAVKTAIEKTIARLTSAQNTIGGEVKQINKRYIGAQLLWHKRTKTPVPEDLKQAAKDARLWRSQKEVRGR